MKLSNKHDREAYPHSALIDGAFHVFKTRTAKRHAQKAAGTVGQNNPLHAAQPKRQA